MFVEEFSKSMWGWEIDHANKCIVLGSVGCLWQEHVDLLEKLKHT